MRIFAAAALVALFACALGSATARAAIPTINVTYTSNSLQVKLGDGTAVSAGTTIPAGSYTVVVYDFGDFANPQFTLNGPGISVSSSLDSTGMGIEVPWSQGPLTFQTSSSYTISDANMGASSRISFSTSATATAGSGGSTTTGATTTTGGSTATGSGSTNSSSSGSTGMMMMGTLTGSVSSAGKATLTFDGKPLKSVKAGLYRVTIADHSRFAGLIIGKTSSKPVTITSATAMGTSSHSLTLSAGKWFLEASAKGPKAYFTVD